SYIAKVPQRVSYHDLLKSNPIICSSVMVDAYLLGASRMPVIGKNEDFSLWLELLKRAPYAYGLADVCGVYTVRHQSVSASKVAAARQLWRIYRRTENLGCSTALYCFAHFLLRWIKNRIS